MIVKFNRRMIFHRQDLVSDLSGRPNPSYSIRYSTNLVQGKSARQQTNGFPLYDSTGRTDAG
jgi:hypothetical protein